MIRLYPKPQKMIIDEEKVLPVRGKHVTVVTDNCDVHACMIKLSTEYLSRLFDTSGPEDRRAPLVITLSVDENILEDATGQAYILTNDCSGTISIVGSSANGVLYGVQTLTQIYEQATPNLPKFEVEDWPDYKYRLAANWLQNYEVARWGYDRGQGIAKFIEAGKQRIDWALKYKINMIYLDCSYADFRIQMFPGFSQIASTLNRYARERGIRLMSGGTTAFGMRNRTSYPDGETYPCMGIAYPED